MLSLRSTGIELRCASNRTSVTNNQSHSAARPHPTAAGPRSFSYSHYHRLLSRTSVPFSLTNISVMASTSAASNPPMPPANADLATTWAYLEEGVDHIMTKLQTGVSYSKYMSLYTVSYNYCTSSKMHSAGELTLGQRSKWTPPLPAHRYYIHDNRTQLGRT